MTSSIDQNVAFTRKKMAALRQALKEKLPDGPYSIVTVGSYGREEASDESDLDFFMIHCEEMREAPRVLDQARSLAMQIVNKPPSVDGAFGKPESIESMLRDIGGGKDENDKITRRVLFLLESAPIHQEKNATNYMSRLLERYVGPPIKADNITRFFLNDVIRYWRTVCIDYEFKTQEAGKDWAIRNIKLVWSRKLLYFGGVLMAAETYGLSRDDKIKRLLQLAALSPIARLKEVGGDKAEGVLELYNYFLEKLSAADVREQLKKLEASRRDEQPYRELKDRGEEFSTALEAFLCSMYSDAHPIHRALIL